MQMVQIEQLIQGQFPYNNLSINCLIFNMSNPISDNKVNSKEYLASIFPNAVLDGCIVVYEAMFIAWMLK